MKTIQRIFADHAAQYLKLHGATRDQLKVLNAICRCRTPMAGRHAYECPDCGKTHLADSSCGNRHCPVCQNDKAADWVSRQELKALPCTYFMATFTMPQELHRVARLHPKEVYKALFDAAEASLKILMHDKRFVGTAFISRKRMRWGSP